MKKYFLLSTILFAVFANAAAQNPIETVPPSSAPVAGELISAGNWMVGGSVGSLGVNFDTKTFQLDVNPSAAYFVGERVAVGMQTIVGLTAYDGGTNYRYGITPMARYYFAEGARPSGRWFTEARVGFAGSSLVDNPSDENFSFLLGIDVGYAHFIADHVALEGKVGYTDTEADITGSGLGVTLGFQIYLPGRER